MRVGTFLRRLSWLVASLVAAVKVIPRYTTYGTYWQPLVQAGLNERPSSNSELSWHRTNIQRQKFEEGPNYADVRLVGGIAREERACQHGEVCQGPSGTLDFGRCVASGEVAGSGALLGR